MKQKIITLLFFVLFVAVFGYFYGEEYKEFYEKQATEKYQQQEIQKQIQGFSLNEISSLVDNKLYTTPNTDLLNEIVETINTSKKRVYLEVYIFTEKRIFEALKNAHNRGVEIKVILEQNPYMAPNLNNQRYDLLKKTGINVAWSNSSNYALNHSKVLIVDDEAFISTGNMSYSTFTKNRDFFIRTGDTKIVESLTDIFEADFQGIKISPYHESLVVSPDYSRKKLQHMLESATSQVHIYFQYLQDDQLLEVLKDTARRGVTVEIILDDDFYEEESLLLEELRNIGIQIYKYPKSVMHGKAVLVDKKYLFIGSINFSSYSLDQNREVGIIISDETIIGEFLQVFSGDIGG